MLKGISAATLAAFAIAAPAAAAAPAPCTGSPALKFKVTKDGAKRHVDLSYTRAATTGTAAKPIAVTVIRSGQARTVLWKDLEGQYAYQPRKGEVVRFAAVYGEDSSGYGGTTFDGPLQIGLIPVPGLSLLPPAIQALLPQGGLPLIVPAQGNPGLFVSRICGRALTLTVSEATSARKARVRRSF